jgi:hypothetical protein
MAAFSEAVARHLPPVTGCISTQVIFTAFPVGTCHVIGFDPLARCRCVLGPPTSVQANVTCTSSRINTPWGLLNLQSYCLLTPLSIMR